MDAIAQLADEAVEAGRMLGAVRCAPPRGAPVFASQKVGSRPSTGRSPEWSEEVVAGGFAECSEYKSREEAIEAGRRFSGTLYEMLAGMGEEKPKSGRLAALKSTTSLDKFPAPPSGAAYLRRRFEDGVMCIVHVQ